MGINGGYVERRGEEEGQVNQRERQVEVILAVARGSCQEGAKGETGIVMGSVVYGQSGVSERLIAGKELCRCICHSISN